MMTLLKPDRNVENQVNDNQVFMADIRQYNSLLAFASIHTRLYMHDLQQNNNRFIYKIHGAIYFRFPALVNPNHANNLETAQFYILDTDVAHEQRQGRWRGGGYLYGQRQLNVQVKNFIENSIFKINFKVFLYVDITKLRRYDQSKQQIC